MKELLGLKVFQSNMVLTPPSLVFLNPIRLLWLYEIKSWKRGGSVLSPMKIDWVSMVKTAPKPLVKKLWSMLAITGEPGKKNCGVIVSKLKREKAKHLH